MNTQPGINPTIENLQQRTEEYARIVQTGLVLSLLNLAFITIAATCSVLDALSIFLCKP